MDSVCVHLSYFILFKSCKCARQSTTESHSCVSYSQASATSLWRGRGLWVLRRMVDLWGDPVSLDPTCCGRRLWSLKVGQALEKKTHLEFLRSGHSVQSWNICSGFWVEIEGLSMILSSYSMTALWFLLVHIKGVLSYRGDLLEMLQLIFTSKQPRNCDCIKQKLIYSRPHWLSCLPGKWPNYPWTKMTIKRV